MRCFARQCAVLSPAALFQHPPAGSSFCRLPSTAHPALRTTQTSSPDPCDAVFARRTSHRQACVARLHITVTAGYPEHAAACRVTIQPTAVHHHVHGMPLGGVSHTHTHQSSVTLPPQGLGGSPGLGPAQGLQHRDLGSDPLSRHRRRWAEEMTGRVAAAAREAALQVRVRGFEMGLGGGSRAGVLSYGDQPYTCLHDSQGEQGRKRERGSGNVGCHLRG